MLIGFLQGDATLGINVHDTVFIIAKLHVAIFISLLFAILGQGYWMMNRLKRKLSNWLSRSHTTITLGALLISWILSFVDLSKNIDSDSAVFDSSHLYELILILIIIMVLLAQILYVINLFIGMFRPHRTNCG